MYRHNFCVGLNEHIPLHTIRLQVLVQNLMSGQQLWQILIKTFSAPSQEKVKRTSTTASKLKRSLYDKFLKRLGVRYVVTSPKGHFVKVAAVQT